MFCKNCGKEIQDGATFCPECGASQQEKTSSPTANNVSNSGVASQPQEVKESYNSMCIIGLVVSCISLLLNFFGIVAIAGTIISVIGLLGCKQKNEKGKNLAIIGIIIGICSIIYAIYALCNLAAVLG